MTKDLSINDLITEATDNEGLEIPAEDIEEVYEYVLDDNGNVIDTIQTK